MPSTPGRARMRAGTAAMIVVAVVLAYVAGLVTGVVGSAVPASSAESGVLDEAADSIAARAATPIDRAALNQAAVDGMLGRLGDRWSTYYGADDFASFSQSLEGRYTGVGLWVSQSDGEIRVSSVTEGSAADDSGVRSGDVLLAVDGVATTRTTSIATVASLLRGAPGTEAKVDLRRGDDERSVTLTRSTVTTRDVTIDRVASDVTVVRVAAFTRGVGRQVRSAVGDAGAGAGVVLDLRANPGGLLTEAVEVASAFLDGGPVVSYERRATGTTRLDAVGSGDADIPVVVLVDASTASAAEVVAGALQDRGRAVVVGSRTFGKGSVQEPSRLSDGSAIELTVGRYLTPKGRSIDGTGVEPDVLVDRDATRAVAEARAVQVLTGLQASVGTSGRG